MQKVEIQKWGNSAAIRLNKALLNQLSCDVGATFEVSIRNGGVFLKPVKPKPYDLDELLESCSSDKVQLDQDDTDWLQDAPVGKES